MSSTTSGDLTGQLIKQGRTGTAYYVAATDYLGGSNENQKHLVTYRYDVSPGGDQPHGRLADRDPVQLYVLGGDRHDQDRAPPRCRPWPAARTARTPPRRSVEYYDSRGRLRWQQDAAGAVTYYSYHPQHGQLAYTRAGCGSQRRCPARPTITATKWVEPRRRFRLEQQAHRAAACPRPCEQVTRHEFDSQGRLVLTATEEAQHGTILARHYTVYETNRLLQFPYWDTSTNKPLLPIEATVFDDGGTVTEQYAVDPARTAQSGGVPTGLSAGTDQSHYLRWTRPAVRCRVGRTDRHARLS